MNNGLEMKNSEKKFKQWKSMEYLDSILDWNLTGIDMVTQVFLKNVLIWRFEKERKLTLVDGSMQCIDPTSL